MPSLVPCILPAQLPEGSLPQIYELSFQSQQSRDEVQSFTRQWPTPCIMTVTSSTVAIRTDKSFDLDYMNWEFRDKALMSDSDKRSLHNRVLNNGNQLKFVEENEHKAICYSDNILADMIILCDYLITILNSQFLRLIINPYQFEDKRIDYQNYWIPMTLEVSEGAVTSEEMKLFLEGFPGVPTKILNCYPGRNFSTDKPLSADYLTLYYGQWLKLHHLLNLDCIGLKLANCDLTSQDFNVFIKNWLISDNKKLEYLFVRGKVAKGENDEEVCGFKTLDVNVITNDIRSIGRRNYQRFRNAYDGESFGIKWTGAQGLNIKRADKKTASIFIQEEPSHTNHFLFLVWN